jgi:hypothetical protein
MVRWHTSRMTEQEFLDLLAAHYAKPDCDQTDEEPF